MVGFFKSILHEICHINIKIFESKIKKKKKIRKSCQYLQDKTFDFGNERQRERLLCQIYKCNNNNNNASYFFLLSDVYQIK